MKRTPLIRRAPLRAIGKRSRLRDKEWKVNRKLAMELAGGRCEYEAEGLHHLYGRCAAPAVHVHHLLPSSAGGSHSITNLRALCEFHHSYIHAHPTAHYASGWLISRYGRTE
jgi:5-methylcytosine-specific restriction endonuclease McrA